VLKEYKNSIACAQRLKQEIDSLRPLTKKQLNELKEYYRIGLTYSSNALEGNSLTETETKVVLEEGITIGGKLIKDHLEALGHSDAYNVLLKLATHDQIREKDVRDLHKFFYFRLNQKAAGINIAQNKFLSQAQILYHQHRANYAHSCVILHTKFHF